MTIVVLLGGLFLLAFCCLIALKKVLYFYPDAGLYPPSTSGLKFTDLRLFGLAARSYPNSPEQPTIIFCPGNGGNLAHREYKIQQLHQLGYNIVIFDYPGYGQSDGVPSEERCYHSAIIVAQHLLRSVPADQLVLYGESLGAAVAAHTARHFGLKTLILESSLPSIRAIANHRYPALAVVWEFFTPEFDTERDLMHWKLDHPDSKCLVIHSRHDEIIPYELTDHLRRMADQAVTITGGHNTPAVPWPEVRQFINGMGAVVDDERKHFE